MCQPTRSFSDADIKGPAGRPLDPQVKLVVPLGPPAVSTDIQGPLYGPRYHDDAEQRPTARMEGPTTEGPTTEGPTTEGPTTEGPTTEGPVTEGPATEGPTTQQNHYM